MVSYCSDFAFISYSNSLSKQCDTYTIEQTFFNALYQRNLAQQTMYEVNPDVQWFLGVWWVGMVWG